VYTIAKRIHEDEFLKRHIIEIHQGANAEFELRLRNSDLRVELGDLSELDRKFSNLKAFYQKVLKDDIMDRYRKLNLRFTSQVICTKA
jgi:cell division protein FtsQ